MVSALTTRRDLTDAAERHGLETHLRPWVVFLRAHAGVMRRLEAELEVEQGISLADYDALMQLALADGRLRMNELADRLLLTRSGASRLVDRLEEDGYVARHKCATEARGAYAVLTEAGRERLVAVAPTHLRGVDEHFIAVLPSRDRVAFMRALETVLDRLEPEPATPDAGDC
ncbi:MAG: MarR family winged helix-turn-helix transcriptional regulator [Candidatus Limnocylindrales bacterium]